MGINSSSLDADVQSILQKRIQMAERIRNSQASEIGFPLHPLLGNKVVRTSLYVDMDLLSNLRNLPGLEEVLFQDWENAYSLGRYPTCVPLVKEFFDCGIVKSRYIRTRVVNTITNFGVVDAAIAMNVRVSQGDNYRDDWREKCPDHDCIWLNISESYKREPSNLIESCRFIHFILCKTLLPKDSLNDPIDDLTSFAIYKILKRVKVNPIRLAWKHLLNWIQDPNGSLPFGSLISKMIGQKNQISCMVRGGLLLENDFLWPRPILCSDLKRIRFSFDDEDVPNALKMEIGFDPVEATGKDSDSEDTTFSGSTKSNAESLDSILQSATSGERKRTSEAANVTSDIKKARSSLNMSDPTPSSQEATTSRSRWKKIIKDNLPVASTKVSLDFLAQDLNVFKDSFDSRMQSMEELMKKIVVLRISDDKDISTAF